MCILGKRDYYGKGRIDLEIQIHRKKTITISVLDRKQRKWTKEGLGAKSCYGKELGKLVLLRWFIRANLSL